MILLVLIIYVFGVMFTQAITDYLATSDSDAAMAHKDYWGSLLASMYTLFAALTNGIAWADAAKPLQDAGDAWIFLFLIYMCFTFMAVLNVVTGVFCHAAIEGAQR